MRWRSCLPGVIAAICVCATAQDIVVRLVDVRDGHAYANEVVTLQYQVGRGVDSHQQYLRVTTGGDGVARFQLPEPRPETIHVYPNRLYVCADRFGADSYQVDRRQVLSEGCVGRCSKPKGCRCRFGKDVLAMQAGAGEVVLPVRRITAWERFWWRFQE